MMALKDVGKTTPVAEVIRRVLESQGKAMSLEELTVNTLSSWGRDFPNTPYEPIALVYKLSTNILSCAVSFDDIGGKVPLVKSEEGMGDEVPLSPSLEAHRLNLAIDDLKHIKVSLPGN